MRLVDLNPRWSAAGVDTHRHGMGITFDCPHCRKRRLHVAFDVPLDRGEPFNVAGEKQWHREGDTFDTLTLTPSIDASASGHWHGFITNGEAT